MRCDDIANTSCCLEIPLTHKHCPHTRVIQVVRVPLPIATILAILHINPLPQKPTKTNLPLPISTHTLMSQQPILVAGETLVVSDYVGDMGFELVVFAGEGEVEFGEGFG